MGTTFEARAADGLGVTATTSGSGPAVIVIPGGLDADARAWRSVTDRLCRDHQVIVLRRRRYRPELGDPWRWSIADETLDVRALAERIESPPTVVAHSSGAVVALEALLAAPALFGAAVLYEPPLLVDAPLGGRAQTETAALARSGHPRRAMARFFTTTFGLPAPVGLLLGWAVGSHRVYRPLVPAQISDVDAINDLGVRLTAYARLTTPTLVVSGAKSPAHLRARSAALVRVLPRAAAWIILGQRHTAHSRRPEEFARRVADFMRSTGGRSGP